MLRLRRNKMAEPIVYDRNADPHEATRIINLNGFNKEAEVEQTIEMSPIEQKMAELDCMDKTHLLNGNPQIEAVKDPDATNVVEQNSNCGKYDGAPSEEVIDAMVDFVKRKETYGLPVIRNGNNGAPADNGYHPEDGVTPLDKPMVLGRKEPETRRAGRKQKSLDNFFG
jgi:hypothetical protein